ncbi:MAG TPA: hypothetical protein VJ350_01220 [Methanoregula sp.]|nr:hypothetical protein [Methanoregula sp.]
MQAGRSDVPRKPGMHIPQEKMVILAGIVVAGIIIAAVAGSIIFQVPANGRNPANPLVTTVASPHPTTQHPIRSQTPRPSPGVTVQETQRLPVDFILLPGEQTSCGLTCRQLDATITNSGYETAHDVCITVALHNSRNEVINLNGEASIRSCVGDIAGGQSRTEHISINADCGLFASKCIGETLTLQTRVTSVEKTIRFPDQLIAV